MRPGRLLIFVYNCNRGNLSAIKDYSQKLTTGKVPECRLLGIISSPVGIKKGWKRFIQDLPLPCRFLYQDEYEEEFGALLTPLPAVFFHDQKTKSLFISADELGRAQSVDDLIVLVSRKIGGMPASRER
jgi:hypothetical protein